MNDHTIVKMLSDEQIALELLDVAHLGIWKWNIQTGQLFVNERWAEIAGYSLSELEPISVDTWNRLLYVKDRSLSEKELNDVFEGKKLYYKVTCRLLHKNGHFVWIFDQGRVIAWTEDGRPLWMVGTHTDVTDINEMQSKLDEKSELLTRFFDIGIDLMCVTTNDGVFIKTNSAWKECLGYDPEELDGKSALDFIHPDDTAKTITNIQDIINGTTSNNKFINRYRIKDGDYRYLEWRSLVIGKMIYSSARDITEMRQSEERFRALFEDGPIPFKIHDKDTGDIIDVNNAAVKTYRAKSREDFIRNNRWLNPPYSVDDAFAWVKKTSIEGPQTFEWLGRRLDGDVFWEQVTLAPIHIDGKLRVASSTVDIDRLKTAEAENFEIRRRLEFTNRKQRMMMDISSIFMKADPHNFRDTVKRSLGMIGETLRAERVYIFTYDFEENIAINDFEWCAQGVHPHIDKYRKIPMESLEEWVEMHRRGNSIFIPSVSSMRQGDLMKDNLERDEIQSLISVPLTIEGLFYGFIGCNSTNKSIPYTREDENFLKEYSSALMSTMYRIIAQDKLLQSEDLLKRTLFSIGDGVICTNSKGRITMMNNVAEKLTGYKEQEAMDLKFDTVFDIYNEITRDKYPNIVEHVLSTGNSLEIENHAMLKNKNGRIIEIEYSASPIIDSDGKIAGVVVVFRNCSEKRERQRRIEYLSMHDPLTGLYNRRYIEKVLPSMDNSDNYPLTVMYADINGLKLTNDAFGHHMGDKLITRVSEILLDSTRSGDIIGRVGGDEFIIIVPNTDESGALAIKNRIQEKAAAELLDSIVVSIAIGFSSKTDDQQPIEDLQKIAENLMYKDKLRHGKTMRSQTIDTVLRNINNKYDNEQIHTERVAQFAEILAREAGLSEKEIMDIKIAGVLHDIGKIMVPPEFLNKVTKLSQGEFEIIKQHSEIGYQILKSVDEYAALAEIVLHHHERWDGKGYPHELSGEEIPLGSRIISIVDAFEAMTANRPYQMPKTLKEAVDEIKLCSGTQFDPALVPCFVRLFEKDQLTMPHQPNN